MQTSKAYETTSLLTGGTLTFLLPLVCRLSVCQSLACSLAPDVGSCYWQDDPVAYIKQKAAKVDSRDFSSEIKWHLMVLR